LKLPIRAQLFLSSVLIIATVGAATGLFLEKELRSWLLERVERETERQAFLVREGLQTDDNVPLSQNRQADLFADRFGHAINARVTLIDKAGVVLGDSALSFDSVKQVDNHLQRPEVLDAQKHGVGSSLRFSDTLQEEMLYVAVPYEKEASHGYIRIAVPVAVIQSTTEKLRYLLLLAGLIGLGIALFMSGFASHLLLRTFQPLLQRAQSLVKRPMDTEAVVQEGGEMEALSFSLERASDHLQDSIQELGKERDRIEAVLEGMDEGVIGLDAELRVTLVNRGARELFNLPKHTLGMAIQRLIPNPEFLQLISDSKRHGAAETEMEIADPTAKLILVRATPQRSTDGVVIVLYDITRVRHLEQMRKDFVANVSHELRTPVSVVQLNAETLLSGALDNSEQAHRFVEGIMRNAKRLSCIINDLLDLSRIEAEKFEISTSSIPARILAERAVHALSSQIEARKMTVNIEIDKDVHILGDENALEQILSNLIDNATKYTPEGGRIVVRATQVLSTIRIEVIDDGPGIPPEHHDRLFERFYRVDAGRSREMGGTGLGLAIVKHLAATMGGQVGVESTPPNGALFWVSLPATTSSNPSNTP